MRRSGIIIGLLALCMACSSSTEEGGPETGQGPKLTRSVATALIEEMLLESDLSTRTPSLRHDLPCIEMANAVIIDETGRAALHPDVAGFFRSVVSDDGGFHLVYSEPKEWEVTIENLWELSPGVVEVSYSASMADPPVHLALWFEACASESGTEKMALTDQGTRNAEWSEDGGWKLRPQG